MSPLQRSKPERFTGWLAGIGTAGGHRVMIGHWHSSPYGAVTDVTVEDRAGHRTLDASTPQLAESSPGLPPPGVHVAACSTPGAGSSWTVGQAAAVLVHHRTPRPAGLAAVGHWATAACSPQPRTSNRPDPQICGADMTLDASAEICLLSASAIGARTPIGRCRDRAPRDAPASS